MKPKRRPAISSSLFYEHKDCMEEILGLVTIQTIRKPKFVWFKTIHLSGVYIFNIDIKFLVYNSAPIQFKWLKS